MHSPRPEPLSEVRRSASRTSSERVRCSSVRTASSSAPISGGNDTLKVSVVRDMGPCSLSPRPSARGTKGSGWRTSISRTSSLRAVIFATAAERCERREPGAISVRLKTTISSPPLRAGRHQKLIAATAPIGLGWPSFDFHRGGECQTGAWISRTRPGTGCALFPGWHTHAYV
jgi:hypothetical protein